MARYIDPQQVEALTERAKKNIKVEATEEEKSNGWTDASLQSYLAERHAQRLAFMMSNQAPKRIQVRGYDDFNPHDW